MTPGSHCKWIKQKISSLKKMTKTVSLCQIPARLYSAYRIRNRPKKLKKREIKTNSSQINLMCSLDFSQPHYIAEATDVFCNVIFRSVTIEVQINPAAHTQLIIGLPGEWISVKLESYFNCVLLSCVVFYLNIKINEHSISVPFQRQASFNYTSLLLNNFHLAFNSAVATFLFIFFYLATMIPNLIYIQIFINYWLHLIRFTENSVNGKKYQGCSKLVGKTRIQITDNSYI